MSFWDNNKDSIKSGGIALVKGAGKATAAVGKAGYGAYKNHKNGGPNGDSKEDLSTFATNINYQDPKSFPAPPIHGGPTRAANPNPGSNGIAVQPQLRQQQSYSAQQQLPQQAIPQQYYQQPQLVQQQSYLAQQQPVVPARDFQLTQQVVPQPHYQQPQLVQQQSYPVSQPVLPSRDVPPLQTSPEIVNYNNPYHASLQPELPQPEALPPRSTMPPNSQPLNTSSGQLAQLPPYQITQNPSQFYSQEQTSGYIMPSQSSNTISATSATGGSGSEEMSKNDHIAMQQANLNKDLITEPKFETNLMEFDISKFGAAPPKALRTEKESREYEVRQAEKQRLKNIKEQSLQKALDTVNRSAISRPSISPSVSSFKSNLIKSNPSEESQPKSFELPDISNIQPPPVLNRNESIPPPTAKATGNGTSMAPALPSRESTSSIIQESSFKLPDINQFAPPPAVPRNYNNTPPQQPPRATTARVLPAVPQRIRTSNTLQDESITSTPITEPVGNLYSRPRMITPPSTPSSNAIVTQATGKKKPPKPIKKINGEIEQNEEQNLLISNSTSRVNEATAAVEQIEIGDSKHQDPQSIISGGIPSPFGNLGLDGQAIGQGMLRKTGTRENFQVNSSYIGASNTKMPPPIPKKLTDDQLISMVKGKKAPKAPPK